MIAARYRRREIIATAQAVAILVIGASFAAAAPRIPSSELPGRERERFVDPPAARLMQPSAPTTILPYGKRRLDGDCRTPKGRRLRQRCPPVR